jgi:serine/threonine protein kinase
MRTLQFTGRYEAEALEETLSRALGSGYRLERELMGGGMSRVFVALEFALERRVAVKVLPSDLAATVSIERFRREILVSAALQHPNIVPVLSAGEADGLPFFIMPYIEGASIRTRLRGGTLAVRDVVHIMRDVGRALEFAHARGVVHRDIKPDNILSAGGVAVVTDFGVAKAINAARASQTKSETTITRVGTSLGTPAYMAPEQIAADPSTDHRADIYSLGVTVYEMLSGEAPFRGETPQEMLSAQMTAHPAPLSTHRDDVPAALERLVFWCLEKQPDKRPQSASDIIASLDDPSTMSGDFATPISRRPRSIRWLAIALGLAVTGVITVVQFANRSAAPDPHSIAVLPIAVLSEDTITGQEALALAANLRSSLGQLLGVHVASRSTGSNATVFDPVVIGRQLHVSNLVQAALERDGKRVRFAVQLVSTKDGLSIWSDVFEAESKSLFDVQRIITDHVVRGIGQQFSASAALP